MTFVRLIICVVGIYASFLSWALVQERLSTTPYNDSSGGEPRFFRSVVFLNTVQSTFSFIAALVYLSISRKPGQTLRDIIGLGGKVKRAAKTKSEGLLNGNGYVAEKLHQKNDNPLNLLGRCLPCALLHSVGSPFGFASLRHIDYPTMILGKSCKLVPVMLMNIVLYRRRFAAHKYVVVAMVTAGISMFMLNADHSGTTKKGAEKSSLFGLALLLINLLIDGATNSTQDDIFAKFTVSGSQLMFIMNGLSTIITFFALVVPLPTIPILNPVGSAGTNELASALIFIHAYPAVLRDILLFSATGAAGQLFIFETLAHFGSLTLVTITVTRKLFTMLLSVVVFNHHLALGQWVGVVTVFAGIGMEGYVKLGHGRAKQIVDEKSKARMKEM